MGGNIKGAEAKEHLTLSEQGWKKPLGYSYHWSIHLATKKGKGLSVEVMRSSKSTEEKNT